MSKFFNIDDWEPVDLMSTGLTAATGGAALPLAIGFSIFMAGEAGTPPEQPSKESMPDHPSKKNSAHKNIFIGMEPPKPSWVQM